MKRIKEKQAKMSKKNEYIEPTTHAEGMKTHSYTLMSAIYVETKECFFSIWISAYACR